MDVESPHCTTTYVGYFSPPTGVLITRSHPRSSLALALFTLEFQASEYNSTAARYHAKENIAMGTWYQKVLKMTIKDSGTIETPTAIIHIYRLHK